MLKQEHIGKPEFIESLNDKQLIDKLIETKIESQIVATPLSFNAETNTEVLLVKPAFITNHPLLMSPLAKSHAQGRMHSSRGAKYLSERFELFANGMELCNAYSEQNDSSSQRRAFLHQTSELGGKDDELHRNDESFLEALSYGMPPTAGWGMGIDRLCMLMCGVTNIREAILFPRPD